MERPQVNLFGGDGGDACAIWRPAEPPDCQSMSEGVQQFPAGTLPDADIAIQAGGGKKPSVRRPGQVHDGPLVRVLITPQRKAIAPDSSARARYKRLGRAITFASF